MNPNDAEYLTIAEAARAAGIGKTKLYQILQTRAVEAVKLGSRTLVRAESLRAFLAELPEFGGARS